MLTTYSSILTRHTSYKSVYFLGTMQLTSQSFYERRKGYKRGARDGGRLLVGDVGRLGQYIQRFDHTPFGTGAAAPLENALQLLAAEDRVAHSHIQHLYVGM